MGTSAFDTLAVRLSVMDGIHHFFDLVDTGRASATVALFHPDATLTFGPGSPQPGTIAGPSIKSAMEARENLLIGLLHLKSMFDTRWSYSGQTMKPVSQCRHLLPT